MSNNINTQDIEDILISAKTAMEAVGLPMEKFVAFNEAKAPVLFSSRLNPVVHSNAIVDPVIADNKGQKISL